MEGGKSKGLNCRPVVKVLAVVSLLAAPTVSTAAPIAIQQLSAFLYADELGGALEITELGYFSHNDFSSSHVDVSFSSHLDADNLGHASWAFTSFYSGTLSNARLFLFLDADIDEASNTYFNEHGMLSRVDGLGAADIFADSWEIDEPGYLFGDVYSNMSQGALDNTNSVASGSRDDVSLALGFDLGHLNFNDSWIANAELSLSDIGGLLQFDEDSNFGFYFNGSVSVQKSPITVSEPGTLYLFAIAGLLAPLSWAGKRFRRRLV